jgi:hypothetical protein
MAPGPLHNRYLKNLDYFDPDWYCCTMDGLESAKTENLLVIRDNLLKGLDKVAEHLNNGTLDVGDPAKKVNPPRAGGELTLLLLAKVNEILDKRGVAPKW